MWQNWWLELKKSKSAQYQNTSLSQDNNRLYQVKASLATSIAESGTVS